MIPMRKRDRTEAVRPFDTRCPYCNSEAEVDPYFPGELVCPACQGGTEKRRWKPGNL